jgi:malate/lactate dehydrogenase
MKIGIIGAGAVGAACAFAIVMRGCASELVLLDLDIRTSDEFCGSARCLQLETSAI